MEKGKEALIKRTNDINYKRKGARVKVKRATIKNESWALLVLEEGYLPEMEKN